ncbi:MAG: acyltransferase family protein [Acetivibrio sp.]
MKTTFFSKQDTQIGKGIAVVLMLFHHLFAFNNRIMFPVTSLLPRFPIDFLSILSQFGSICVSLFVLLSGIGIYKVSQKQNVTPWRIHHLKVLLFRYLLVFFICVPVGFVFFGKSFQLGEFFSNLFLLSFSYNKEWWFLRIYVELLLFSPFLIHIIKKDPWKGTFLSLCLNLTGLYIRFRFPSNFLLKEISNLLLWQFIFVLGCLLAAFEVYEKIGFFLEKKSWNKGWYSPILLLLCILLRQYPLFPQKIKDPLLAPFFLYFSLDFVKTVHCDKLFALLGKHSMNMWLVHTFFCYYYLPKLVFFPRNSLLIGIWLIFLSFTTSCLISFVEFIILKGIKKCRKRKSLPSKPL